MANIDSGHGGSGRKSINQEIPLVPFIDLLLCTVMFLLVTAVWVDLAQMQARVPGPSADSPQEAEQIYLEVALSEDGYVLRSSIGTEIDIPQVNSGYDFVSLQAQLARYRYDVGQANQVHIQPDDDVGVGAIATTMDVLRGEGFTSIAFPGAS